MIESCAGNDPIPVKRSAYSMGVLMLRSGSMFSGGGMSSGLNMILFAMIALSGLTGCGDSGDSGKTDSITIDEVNACMQEIHKADGNAFDECTIDNGTVGSYAKECNASSTLFIEGSTVTPKTRKWLFKNYTDPLTGYSANGTIDEVWSDSNTYSGTCDITWNVTGYPALHIAGTKSKISGVYSGTLVINGVSFDAASVSNILTGSH